MHLKNTLAWLRSCIGVSAALLLASILPQTAKAEVVAIQQLVITEIHYNPPESGTDSLEYIEIYNAGSYATNLDGYYFVGVTYTFGNVNLNPGEYIVVCVDSLALYHQFGVSGYQWSGALSNGGEGLALRDTFNTLVDTVFYGNSSPWPGGDANGYGPSIVLCDPMSDNNVGSNWQVSQSGTGIMINGYELKGSPGAYDAACPVMSNALYVNDNSTSGDVYTTAIGNDANSGTSSAPFATLNYAISVASPGDTIFVDVGNYPTGQLTINKAMCINGANMGQSGYGSRINGESHIDFSNTAGTGARITINTGDNVQLDGLKFSDNAAFSSGSRPIILVSTHGDHKIQYNIISRESASGSGSSATSRGIEIASIGAGKSLLIYQNHFLGNVGSIYSGNNFRSGIYYNGGAGSVVIDSNQFSYNRSAINVDNPSPGLNIESNNFNYNGTAISYGGSTPPGGSYTILQNNFRVDNYNLTLINLSNVASGFYLNATSSNFNDTAFSALNKQQLLRVENQIVHGTNSGKNGLVRVKENQVFLIPTTDNPDKGSLQRAVDISYDGDTINVDSGTYSGNTQIDKDITLLSCYGKDQTILDGDDGGTQLGTIQLMNGRDGVQIGASGMGFHIKGIDGPMGLEKAAIYLQGAQTNITIEGNEIEARGDAGLMGEYNAANDGVVINENMFTGQTFDDPAPVGDGFSKQFNLGNVPRQAVVFGGGTSTSNTQNFTFTNNVITTIAGGISTTDNDSIATSAHEQGNTLVTLDVIGTNVITGNNFEGKTNRYAGALRTRGTGYTIEENRFIGDYAIGMETDTIAVTAEKNYWGATSGPYNPTNNPCASGKYVPDNVDFDPFFTDVNLTTLGSPSAAPVTNVTQGTPHCSIQEAIDAATAGDSIYVSAGNYNEDVIINKSVVVQGAGIGNSVVSGPIGGDGATFRISASGVKLDGFTITRDGNNTSDWNNASLNYAGIAIQGQTVDAEISNNEIIGNRSGIDVNNSNDNNIHNNIIYRNHTGMIFRNQTDNTNLEENSITENRTVGVLFLDASNGSNSPVQSAINSTFNGNDISANWYGQIVDRQAGGSLPSPGTNSKNFECNWYGTTMPEVSTANSNEPSYSVLIPTYYGGTATDTASTPDILGPASANFDYVFFLNDGTDNNLAKNGFQAVPGSCAGCPGGGLVTNVNTGNKYCSIQDAIDDGATNAGDTIMVSAGTYHEDLLVNKSNLTLRGAGIDQSIIDHSGQPGNGNAGVYILANGVTMKGFTVIDNDGSSGPRYGLKVGTSSVTTDDVVLDSVKVQNSYRTGFDLARPKNITLKDVFAENNGGAGIFMSNVEGATLENITTSGNPWTGVAVATRHDWPGDTYGVEFTGTNSFGESTGKNGGLQLESDNTMLISWSNNSADGKDVTIQSSDFGFVLSGPTSNYFDAGGGNTIWYAPYYRFYQTQSQGEFAAGDTPDHVDAPRYLRDADNSDLLAGTNFYVYDNAYMTIQAAVDAAIGGNIVNVYSGEFVEQVEITKDLTLLGQGQGLTTIKGFANMPLSFITSNTNVPIIYVHDANNVIVNNLTVDGDGQGNSNYRYQGVAYSNAGGFIGHLEVKGIRDNPLSGAQGGIGIFVDASTITPRGIIVSKCTVYDFQKTGISFSGGNLTATADSNVVTGSGSLGIPFPAQNGIQFYGTSGGNITNNQISDLNYTPSTYVATGILTYNDGGPIYIVGNVLDSVEMGIYGQNNSVNIFNNEAMGGEYGFYSYADSGSTASSSVANNSFDKYDYAVILENNGGTFSSSINNNSFIDIEDTAVYAIGLTDTVDANCNWYDTTNASAVADHNFGKVNYTPWLVNGTDNNPDRGFQPVPGSCTGTPPVLCMDTVYVNDNDTSGDVYTSAIGDNNNAGTADAPVATISKALSLACDSAYIYVDAGVYEDTLSLDSTYFIRGANFGISPNTGSRVAESIIYPAASDPDLYSATGVSIFYLTANANGSQIDGLTIDGDNPNLTSGVVFNGADVDAVELISAYEDIANINISNNILRHVGYTAIDLYNVSGNATSGNTISENLFQNITPSSFGIAILIYNNCYTNIFDNVMEDVRVGVQTGNFYKADPGNSHNISGNEVEAVRIGIWNNLAYTNASTFNIEDNTITKSSLATGNNTEGLKVTSLGGNVGVSLEGNTVNGTDIGVDLWNNSTSNLVTVGYNILMDCDTAIFANNYDGYNSDAASSAYIIDSVDIQNAQVAVLVKDNSSNSNGATVSVSIRNYSTVNSEKGLVIEGADASASFDGPTPVSFVNQSTYIDQVTNGTDWPNTDMNALAVLFDGKIGNDMSPAERQATEDKIYHKPDTSIVGLVTYYDICPDGSCGGCYVMQPFNEGINTSTSPAPDTWYTDRYEPDSFYVSVDSVLIHSIAASDGANNRPAAFSSAFYNTQGKKYDLDTTTKMISIDLYVPASWETTGRRMAGIWGTAFDDSNVVSGYPILEFTSDNGNARFQGYEGDGSWIDMALPCNFQYDQWHTLRIELLPTGEFRYSMDNSRIVTSQHGVNGSQYIGNVILQGYNTTAGVSYDINWDNFVNGNGPTIYYDYTLPEPITIGSGISNEHMAVGEYCGLNGGLKAFKRYLGDVTPVDGNIYQFGTGVSPTSSANTTPDSGTARWNFLYSVDLGGFTFNDLNVYLDVDFDPSDESCQTGPYVANISQFLIDNGQGALSSYQGSENIGFSYWQGIGDSAILPFDPYTEGTYDLTLRIENKQGVELMDLPIHVEVACEYIEPSENLEPPVLSCPADTTINAGIVTDPWYTGMATVSGGCPQNLTYSDDRSGLTGCSGTGDLIRTWYNEDSSQTCTQTITIIDSVGPVLNACGQDTILYATSAAGATLEFDSPLASDVIYSEGFENPSYQSGSGSYQGWNAYNTPVERVASGTDGINSASGGYHAILDTNGSGTTGSFCRLGGYSSSFGNGFTASQEIYIDLSDPAVAANTYGWDLSTSASRQNGNHLRDYVFHAASNASGHVLIAGSNNTNFARRNDLATLNHYEISASGWYTFEWAFRDSSGALAVDLNLKDASGNILFTETRYNAADDIASTVGGNRYMWFTFLETARLHIDNTSLVHEASLSCTASSGDTFAIGTTTVVCSASDTCGNTSSCSFNVTVLDTAGSLNFDGVDDVVSVPHDASLTGFGTAITVEAWVKPETVSGNHGILGKWNDLGANDRRSYLLWARDDGAQFYISSDGANFPSALAPHSLVAGQWTHLAGTFDGNTIRLYVNGNLAISTNFNGSIAANTTDPLLIGAVDGGGSSREFFDGNIDGVRIYHRVLCEAEIQAHMGCELNGSEPGLAAYYNFNQGFVPGDNTGLDSLIDQSAHSNTGQLENFALTGNSSNWSFQADSVSGSCGSFYNASIAIYGNNQSINDGQLTATTADSTDFGTVTIGEVNTNSFYIVNSGPNTLMISDTMIVGADAAEFSISELESDAIAVGDSARLAITYSPSATGIHNATVQLVTNDCSISTFDFAIQGTGQSLADICDTIRLITNSDWKMSTTVTQSSLSGNWSGVNGVLPDTSTFTQAVTLGQPYSYQTIYPVDSAEVIRAANNIHYYHKRIFVDSLVDINAEIRSSFVAQAEVYVNGKLLVGHYNFGGNNGDYPPFDARFNNDGTVNNGVGGSKAFDFTTSDTTDYVFQPGINDIIVVIRNLSKSNAKGGFSMSMQVEGCQGEIIENPDTTTPPDTPCDTLRMVANSGWTMSTTITQSSTSGNWSGANGNLPDTSTFTQSVTLGQPYSFQTIFPVDSSKVIQAGNNIRYYHKTIELDSLVGLRARIRSSFLAQAEIYINGHLLVGHYAFGASNGDMPPFDARFNSDGSVDNGVGGNKSYDFATSDSLGYIFKPGINDLVVVIRNLSKSNAKGGFSLSLQVDGCKGEVVEDTTMAPEDSLTMAIVSDANWSKSTEEEQSNYSGNWSGANALPPTPTYTLPAIEGQPYSYPTIDAVDSAMVIKTGNNITFFRREFDLTEHENLNARFRMTVDDGGEIYINGKLIAREDNSGSQNFQSPYHDLKFTGGVSPVNGYNSGDSFDYVSNVDLDTIFVTGTNEVVLAIRNFKKPSDRGGFSFRLDLDKAGAPVVHKGTVISAGNADGLVLNFDLYPNPTTGNFTISTSDPQNTDDNEVAIFDANGRLIIQRTFTGEEAYRGVILDLSTYAKGIYFVRIRSGEHYASKPVMKQ